MQSYESNTVNHKMFLKTKAKRFDYYNRGLLIIRSVVISTTDMLICTLLIISSGYQSKRQNSACKINFVLMHAKTKLLLNNVMTSIS